MTWTSGLTSIEWFFLAYFAALNFVYLALNVLAARVIGRETDASTSWDRDSLSALVPPVSILVPAYNEEPTIADSVRSMLQIEYPTFEVVVVNDGSSDDTLAVLRREFDLVPFPEAYRVSLPTERIRAVYRSLRHRNLRVVDKENGGKSDALNAGLNAARYPLFCAVDADSVLQRDSLLRVVRPFLQDPTTIACGGTVRVANGCRVEEGFIGQVGMPRSWLARVQIVEYLRAFLFGRMGWSPLNAMLIVSGAFGLFKRSVVIEAGGYSTKTMGEDMELVVRLHRQYRLARKPYRIVFVPDPICWTEAPESFSTLSRQRVRWQRGLLESLAANWRLLFHPRAGTVGWLAFPFVLLFEGIGPVVEITGYVVMVIAAVLGFISWQSFAAFLCAALGMGILLSTCALLLEEASFHVYKRPRHLASLIAASLVENIGFRQLTALWRFRGTLEWLVQRPGSWGEMARTGNWSAGETPVEAAEHPLPAHAMVSTAGHGKHAVHS